MKNIITKNDFEEIKRFSLEIGFTLVGITDPYLSDNDKEYLDLFIKNVKYHNMTWFANYKEIRLNPQKIMEGCKSVFVFAFYYKNLEYDSFIKNSNIKISRYAVGKDYHKVLKKKLKRIENFIKEKLPNIKTRITVDSAPVPEKLLAKKAGIGWQGKNTNIIHYDIGSYFFLSCIFTNYDFSKDIDISVSKDHCKGCKLCIDSCPTGALEPYQLNVEKCISYWTIESKSDIPEEIAQKNKGWVFGCDICMEVCPFNRKKSAQKLETNEKDFFPREEIYYILENLPSTNFWENLRNTPLKRVSYQQFVKNYIQIINSYKKNL